MFVLYKPLIVSFRFSLVFFGLLCFVLVVLWFHFSFVGFLWFPTVLYSAFGFLAARLALLAGFLAGLVVSDLHFIFIRESCLSETTKRSLRRDNRLTEIVGAA